MKHFKAEIVENTVYANMVNLIKFKIDRPVKCLPGQFFNIDCSCGWSPLLRRPFSCMDYNGDIVSILYKIRGDGTRNLASKKPGEVLDIIGPLGNGFSLDKVKSKVLMIAGGIGIAPLLYLGKNISSDANKVLLFGARDKSDVLIKENTRGIFSDVRIFTEDGSIGGKGLVTDGLGDMISDFDIVYACGPDLMLKCIADLCRVTGIDLEVSMEEVFGCGTGICYGCVINVNGENKRICKDGPVFNGRDIVWDFL